MGVRCKISDRIGEFNIDRQKMCEKNVDLVYEFCRSPITLEPALCGNDPPSVQMAVFCPHLHAEGSSRSFVCCGCVFVQYCLNVQSDSDVGVLLQFQLLPSALFKSGSDFIPLGKNLDPCSYQTNPTRGSR